MEWLKSKPIIAVGAAGILVGRAFGWQYAESRAQIPEIIKEGGNIDLIAVCHQEKLDRSLVRRNLPAVRDTETGFTAYIRWNNTLRDRETILSRLQGEENFTLDDIGGINVDSIFGIYHTVTATLPSEEVQASVFCPTNAPRQLRKSIARILGVVI